MKLKQLTSAVILATTSAPVFAAAYTLTTTPLKDVAFNSYSQSIDNSGTFLVTTETDYSPPINLSLLDFENEAFTDLFEAPDDVEQGIFSSQDYQTLYNFIVQSRSSSLFAQVLASYRTYQTDNVDVDLIPGFDVTDSNLGGEYTRSAFTNARDSLNGDYFVGTANGAFFELDYTNDSDTDVTYIINDLPQQAFVQVNGQSKVLTPIETAPLGGFGEAYAINSQLQVAGYSSESFTDTYIDAVAVCDDEDSRGDVPIEVCQFNFINTQNDLFGAGYRRATIWDLDTQGNVISSTSFDMVFTPEEDNNSVSYYSNAFDINDNGNAVGESSTGETVIYSLPERNAQRFNQVVATAYIDGEVIELLPRNENLSSSATLINNDDIIVGTVLRENNDVAREQMFIYNLQSGEASYPDGFFRTAAVNPRAINNNGIIVGEGEFNGSSLSNRPLRAFMYDINEGEFIDLNSLLSCEQQEQYTLVTANGINDNNEIVANALFKSPRVYIDGETILDDDGNTEEISRVIAVKLTPNAADDIDACEEIVEENYERKGASLPVFGIVVLALFAVFRRRH